MKNWVYLWLFLLLSCGKSNQNPIVNAKILNNWRGVYENPLLKNLNLFTYEPAYHFLSCNGSLPGQITTIGDIPQGMMLITALTENRGTISFGILNYVGAFNPNCEEFSQKQLNYEVFNDILRICESAPNDFNCWEYLKI